MKIPRCLRQLRGSLEDDAREFGQPLDLDAAEKLDQRIQRMADTAARNLDTLADRLAEAKAGQIHTALGFDSWTAYVADRFKPITKALDREELRALVVQLYEAGMSVRDISATTGVPRSTVGDQVSRARANERQADSEMTSAESVSPQPPTEVSEDQVSEIGQVDGEGAVGVTTGHDRKNYPRKRTPNKSRELTPAQKLVKRAKAIADSMVKVENKLALLDADEEDFEPDTRDTLVGILDPPYERLGVAMNRLRADPDAATA